MTEYKVINNCELGKNVFLGNFINLYGCKIGDESKVGAFVEIQKDVVVGKRCKISSHSFLCSGVKIGDYCFIGHGVMFINDNQPRAVNQSNELEEVRDWQHRYVTTEIGHHVSIGSNATILGGVKIGNFALIGAGSVVTKNIPENEVWVGNPAAFLKRRDTCDAN